MVYLNVLSCELPVSCGGLLARESYRARVSRRLSADSFRATSMRTLRGMSDAED